ncbi:AraC family transcriptional regulator [Flagellimonas sp. CMM7]|uniref:helix-turn-helix domain-containing protein n=1 Tax=Flagellimonas sp. CMM7 TaxID=2654676 RepID=UPI0013D815CF|nr:AraC family transcriptional regulator [Flagellimonas sp. CMM7]UII81426.1 AraC family transcriptional regulator [Flagellimonas sp. CMM7]
MDKDTVILILSSLGIAQALFLSFYLLTLKKGNRNANIFLALAIFGLTIRIGKSILNVHLNLEPWQRNVGLSGILLTGPFLWLYGKVLLSAQKKIDFKDYIHIIPFVLFVFLCTIIPNDGRPISYVIYLTVFAHLAAYIVFSSQVFYKHRTKVHPQRASWYRNLVIGVALIWLFYMGNLAGLFPLYIGGAVFFSVLIYIFSFLFLQKHAFQLGKYNTSSLDKSASEELLDAIKKLFAKEEVFLDNTVSLETIAEKLNVSARKLSQAINENENKNFSDFVNGYRVEKAKMLLTDSKYNKEKIVAIAYDCGFSNATSFNLAFKAKTLLTPSQYRKEFGTA